MGLRLHMGLCASFKLEMGEMGTGGTVAEREKSK
jgi:hypothetical protein